MNLSLFALQNGHSLMFCFLCFIVEQIIHKRYVLVHFVMPEYCCCCHVNKFFEGEQVQSLFISPKVWYPHNCKYAKLLLRCVIINLDISHLSNDIINLDISHLSNNIIKIDISRLSKEIINLDMWHLSNAIAFERCGVSWFISSKIYIKYIPRLMHMVVFCYGLLPVNLLGPQESFLHYRGTSSCDYIRNS